MEITLRTDDALASIEAIASSIPQMSVGAGTVTNQDEFKKAVEDMDIALIPGVATPSEVMVAQNRGFYHCKLFPASIVGGVDMLKALHAPFASMRFCPTGGVNLSNLNDYLSQPNVLCVGGSWIVPKDLIASKRFDEVTRLCREAMVSLE